MYVETALNMTAKIQYMGGAKDIIIQKFMKMIRARDNGEQWAQDVLDSMFQRNEPDIYDRIAEARRKIYAKDAERGNPKAKY